MGSEWREVCFSDKKLLQIEDGDRGKNYPKKAEFTNEGYCLFLSTGNVRKESFEFIQNEFISKQKDESLRKGKLKRKDVVLTTRGTIGNVGYFDKRIPFDNIRINSGMVILRANTKVLNASFLFQFVRSDVFHHQVQSLTSGSAQPQLPIRDLKHIKINLPPLPEQKAIAHILGTLDDKIELNRQMNQTLEQMAQALFQSWFVDFDPVIDNALTAGNTIPEALTQKAQRRKAVLAIGTTPSLPDAIKQQFPNQFVFNDTLNKWIPEGWEVKSVEDAILVNPRVSITKRKVAKFVDMKALPTTGYSVEVVIEKEFKGGSKFNQGDVLLARITPCLQNGKTAIVDFLNDDECGFGSTEFIVFRERSELKTAFIACLARLDSFKNHCIQNMVGSSGRQRVMNSCFSSYFLSLPPNDLLAKFDEFTGNHFSKITSNSKQTETLTQLRDTLLPQLISGKLTIPEAMLTIKEHTAR